MKAAKKFRLTTVSVIALLVILLLASPAMAEIVGYSEGFETTNGDYTHSGESDQWQWGTPTSGPGSAHSGTKLWATNLAGDVPSPSDSYLTSPAISIPALEPNQIARVRFYSWIAVDEMYDRGEFQISSDGVNWETKGEFFHKMQGEWTEYYFDVSDYAGGNVYLRFRLYADYNNAFEQSSYNMAGWYIDDVAIIITDSQTVKTKVSLEASEDLSSFASCPWVYTWDGTEYVKDNDVYSTARGKTKEYTDYYTLSKPLVPEKGQYLLDLRETESETSYNDLVQLVTVDHPSAVKVASDEKGNVWTYINPSFPAKAIDKNGNDCLDQIETEDNTGSKVYNNDYIELDFSNLDISNGATLVLRVVGFQMDAEEGTFTSEQPSVYIQTQDNNGNWVTRNEFKLRWNWATSAYNLKDYLSTSQRVRLYAKSCHEGKYHIIDYVGMDTSPQAQVKINTLSAVSAVHSINGDIKSSISASDNNYATMTALENIALAFDVPAQADEVRDFIFVSEGYYVPMGTFFIYTWDGNGWAQRDAWSVEGSADQTKDFDMSMWLPDPAGEYKVRIWQDYWYEPADIDYVKITRDDIPGTMLSAYDLRKNLDITTQLSASDDSKDSWGPGDSGYPYYRLRNRWVEVKWSGLTVNNPPTTNPVNVTDISSSTPTISWTYNDVDNDLQTQYEVEVWTGSGGTGTSVWDPLVGTGNITSVTYAGTPLVNGQTYYARVKAFDGTSWGGWSEASWTISSNNPPVANAGVDQAVEQANPAGAGITLDGSASTDDGKVLPLTYKWEWKDKWGNGGSAEGVNPVVALPAGTTTVTLTVFDGEFSSTDTVEIEVKDTTAPTITTSGKPIMLWPPNHKYQTLSLSDCGISVTDTCDPDLNMENIVITSVSSDELEDAPGKGDGETMQDMVIVDAQNVDLRAERQGDGNGRVYTVNFEIADESGNIAEGSYQVWVPHDQGEEAAVVDDGADAGYMVSSK